MGEAVSGADIIVLGVPHEYLDDTLETLKPDVKEGTRRRLNPDMFTLTLTP